MTAQHDWFGLVTGLLIIGVGSASYWWPGVVEQWLRWQRVPLPASEVLLRQQLRVLGIVLILAGAFFTVMALAYR